MSKISVVYWSGTGNTAAMAEAIGAGIEKREKKPMWWKFPQLLLMS